MSFTYDERISRVCEFIDHHLDEPLSIAQLSEIASFSKYHFHRVFNATVGLNVVEYVQLMRLKRASFRLAFEPQKRVIDIALEAGFDRPETFSRAFKRHFNQLPSQFRAQPQWQQWNQKYQFKQKPVGTLTMQVNVIEFPTTKVALLKHLGAPDRILETVSKFIRWRKQSGLSPMATSKTFGIPHSDPNLTDPDKFRWDVCSSVEQDVPENAFGVETSTIPGGRCAVIRHKGSHSQLDRCIYYIYQQWLPSNNEETRDFPCYFHYHNFIHQVDECDLLSDIYVPLK